MSEQRATLDGVRGAYETLVSVGKTPSAANILKLTGGSKSTVVKFLQAVRAEKLASKPVVDVPIALLHSLSEPLVRKIWQEAETLANALHEQRIRALEAMQKGLMEDLTESEATAEEALQRAAELTVQLGARDQFELQLDSLKRVVEEIGGTNQRAVPDEGIARESNWRVVCRILSTLAAPVSKEDVDQQMKARGFTAAAAQKARWYVVERGYAEVVGAALRLTEAGRRKLDEAVAA